MLGSQAGCASGFKYWVYGMPQITLPDGSTRQYDQPVTVAGVAESIGPGLAKAALAGRVDGVLVDTSFIIDSDSELAIVTERDDDGIEVLRHSLSLIHI